MRRMRRRSATADPARRAGAAGFTLLELVIVVLVVGVIAAVLIPNLLDSLQKAKQKRTVADIRLVGRSWLAWLTDQMSAAAAGTTSSFVFSYDQRLTSDQLAQTLSDPELGAFHLREVPAADGWGFAYDYGMDAELSGDSVIGIRSGGRDGRFEDVYVEGSFAATAFDEDIVWADGYFIRYPGGAQVTPPDRPPPALEELVLTDLFVPGSAVEPSPEALAGLTRTAEIVKQHPEFVFQVEGHARDGGSLEANLALSDRLAGEVHRYLLSLGIPADQVRTVSRGEELPPCVVGDSVCQAQDRRVRIVARAPWQDDRTSPGGIADVEPWVAWQGYLRRHPSLESASGGWNELLRERYGELGRTVQAAQRHAAPRAKWNLWAERFGQSVDALEQGKTYRVHFDLAAYDYRELLKTVAPAVAETVQPGPTTPQFERYVDDVVAEAPALELARGEIWVQPVLLGDGLELRPGEGRARRVFVEAAYLRARPVAVAADQPAALARTLSALRVDGEWQPLAVEVEATSEGCAAVALSIWNRYPDKPLDYVVQPVTIGGGECDAPPADRTLPARLLAVLGGESKDEAALADAALHIYEMELEGVLHNAAVLVIRKPEPGEKRFYSWVLPETVSDYIGHELKLLQALKNARNSTPYGYEKVSDSLKATLFSGKRIQDITEAGEAARAFDAVLRRTDSPRVHARLIDKDGKALLLPLGLLEFGDNLPFGSRATIVQPLIREDFDNKSCIGPWTFVLPERLDKLVPSDLELVGDLARGRRISKWSNFIPFLGETPVAGRPEGLLLLGHHERGALWFLKEAGTTSAGAFSRPFWDGSVAVLVSCAVGELGQDDKRLDWLERLQAMNVDAVIVSPFEVNAKFGARFAVHFAHQVGEAPRGTTLTQLFERTVAAVEKDPIAKATRASAYEFVIAGNGDLALCGPEEARR